MPVIVLGCARPDAAAKLTSGGDLLPSPTPLILEIKAPNPRRSATSLTGTNIYKGTNLLNGFLLGPGGLSKIKRAEVLLPERYRDVRYAYRDRRSTGGYDCNGYRGGHVIGGTSAEPPDPRRVREPTYGCSGRKQRMQLPSGMERHPTQILDTAQRSLLFQFSQPEHRKPWTQQGIGPQTWHWR